MKLKKITAIILAAVMTMSLAACGQDGTETSKTSKIPESASTSSKAEEKNEEAEVSTAITFPLEEPMTFTMVNRYSNEAKLVDNDTMIAYEEMTNVHFEHTEFIGTEISEKINLMMTSGDYPDVFFKTWIDVDHYGIEGILIPLEDLIREHAPNLTALCDELDLWEELKASDGHIYGLPTLGAPTLKGWYFSYNKTWLDRLGLEMPTNMDELYECLKAIKEKDANGNGDLNDEIPITSSATAQYLQTLMVTAAGEAGVADPYSNWLIYNGNEVSYIPKTELFKEFLATFAKWWEEGLIDEKAFTQPEADIYSIAASQDQYGFIFHNPRVAGAERVVHYQYVQPFEDSVGIPIGSAITFDNAMAITDKCENPEVLVAWADYFYSKEGSLFATYGVEGTHWQFDANGIVEVLDERATTIYTLPGGAPHLTNNNKELQLIGSSMRDPKKAHSYRDALEMCEKYGVVVPIMSMTEEQNEQYNDLNATIKPYVANYMAQVVVGEMDLEETWDDYLAELEKMGVSEMLQIMVDSMPEGYVAVE